MTAIKIPVAKPRLPNAAALLPYLEEIDRNGIYSNFGPLNSRLQAALAAHYSLSASCVVTVANATAGLTLALMAAGVRPGGYCLMPSWTFAATGHAAMAAGLRPYFLDVDENSWALDPQRVRTVIDHLGDSVAAVMPVFPFGAPLDVAIWDELSADTGIPVVIDAAAGFDGLRPGNAPAVVSLHATKSLCAGEGGFVVCRRGEAIAAIAQRANFGFHGRREAMVASLNGKLSEYHAAVALAGLDEWESVRADFGAAIDNYLRHVPVAGYRVQTGFGEHWITASCTVLLDADDAANCAARLGRAGIDTRAWYGSGLHVQPAFAACLADGDLEVTRHLAMRTLGVPLYRDIDAGTIDTIASIVGKSETT